MAKSLTKNLSLLGSGLGSGSGFSVGVVIRVWG